MENQHVESAKADISVIVSVYNHWEWLRLILEALLRQKDVDHAVIENDPEDSEVRFEVVVADDGSDEETCNNLRKWISEHPQMRIKHSWHPDEGWRKNKALNAAVAMAEGDYLIFIDGDCIPHPYFVADHVSLAHFNRVVAGRRADLPKRVSDKLSRMKNLPEGYFGKVARRVAVALLYDFRAAAACLSRMVRFEPAWGEVRGLKPGGILGCNFSLFRDDFEKVGGFDERYIDPGVGEDTDIDLRLRAIGMEVLKTSRCALMLHRCHPRLDLSSARNAALLEETRRRVGTYTGV